MNIVSYIKITMYFLEKEIQRVKDLLNSWKKFNQLTSKNVHNTTTTTTDYIINIFALLDDVTWQFFDFIFFLIINHETNEITPATNNNIHI